MSYPKDAARIRALSLAIALCVALLMFSSSASASWNVNGITYNYRYKISSSATDGWPFNINGTYAPDMWTKNASSNYVYCSASGCATGLVAVGDGSANALPYEIENTTTVYAGYNPAQVWNDTTYKYVFHFKNATSFNSIDASTPLTAYNTPVSVSGVFGNAVNVSSQSNRYFELATFNGSIVSAKNYTVLMFARKLASNSNYDSLLRIGPNSAGQAWFSAACGAGTNYWCMGIWGGNEPYFNEAIRLGEWYCLGFTQNATTGAIFVNGTRRSALALSPSVAASTTFTIGARAGGGSNGYNGEIDELQFINRVLTDAEISNYCKNGFNTLSSIGAEETSGAPPSITIYTPENKTYYNLIDFDALFKATDAESPTFHIKAYHNGDEIYNNASYTSGANITIAGTEIIAGSQNFTVWANDTDGQISQSSVIFYNFYGLNISVFKANGSAISGWNMEIFGGEDPIYNMSLNNPTLIDYETLGSGTLTFIFNYTDAYDFVSNEYDFNSEMGLIPVNVYLYQYEYFTGQDYDTSANITTNITLYNSTFNISDGGTDRHKISLRYLPLGSDVSAVFTSAGYNNSATSYNINLSSYIDSIVKLIPAGVLIKAYNEENVSEQLYFNYLISNGTSEISGTAVNEIALSYTAMPQGDVRLNIWNASYVVGSTEYSFPTRAYFFSVNQFTANRFNAYLLRSDAGFYQTFYVIDQNNQPIEAALITISKVISSVSTTVAQEKTNPAGAASIFIKPYVYYALRLQKDGYLPIYEPSITFTPAVNPQYVYLTSGLATLPAFYNVFYGVQMNIEPADYYIRNITSPLPTNCSVFAEDGNIILSSYSVYRVWNNGTDSQLYSVNSTDPSGNTFIYNGITASGKYKLRCYVEISYDNNVSVMSLETYKEREIFFYEPRGAGGLSSTGFAPFTLELIAVIVIAFVIVFFTQFAGIWAGAVGLVVGGFFVAISWLPFFDFVLTCLVFAAAIVIRYVMI